MTSIIPIDLETYYSSDYTLNKISTEAYIRDPRFEVIGMGIRLNGVTTWHTGADVGVVLNSINWSEHSLLCFNTAFDGAILAWVYGVHPALYLDAMGMARSCGVAFNGAGLGAVCKTMEIGAKGDYVNRAIGKRLRDFTPFELEQYGLYCMNDVDRTIDIYKKLKPKFPLSEILVQDHMLRMFIEPVLMFNRGILQDHYTKTVNEKAENLRKVGEILGLEYGSSEDDVRKILMSNPQFAKLLASIGIEPPKKISPTTGEEAYAFAKTDPNFLELLDHEDSIVQTAVSARLGVKSTIEETRAERFLDIATRGPWPVQYNYWGAHSRFSGGGQANPQNLKRGGRLRHAVEAPAGHTLVAADLRQIECRLVNYVAEQDNVVRAFWMHDVDPANHPDVYCIAASRIYNRTITPEDNKERMAGKVSELSLGYGGGKLAYKRMLFNQTGMTVSLQESEHTVKIYRDSHQKVQKLWYDGNDALDAMSQGLKFRFGKHGVFDCSQPTEGVGLPNGTFIRLPQLRKIMAGNGERKFIYMHKKKPVEIYGAMLVALCIQGLARIIMTDAMLRISERFPTRMMTHDELVYSIVNIDVEEAKIYIHENLVTPVSWAPGLPLACEIGSGMNYGSCK